MSPAKNPLGAIEIARRVDMPIVLAGAPITRDERDFFAHRVRPLIDGRRVHYVGPVNHAEKNELLRHAAALLFPVRWPEPFGIVMIEAMACGTPVVACALGAVPEVIEPGRTGYFADTIDELVALVPNALALDRRVVRRAAEERFSHTRMAGEYLDAYRMVLAGGGVARPSAALA
jgi:glycosyltransferase involved in cell wall biosynthesis